MSEEESSSIFSCNFLFSSIISAFSVYLFCTFLINISDFYIYSLRFFFNSFFSANKFSIYCLRFFIYYCNLFSLFERESKFLSTFLFLFFYCYNCFFNDSYFSFFSWINNYFCFTSYDNSLFIFCNYFYDSSFCKNFF